MSEIKFVPLDWKAKGLYQHYYPINIYATADLCFTTLWLWRKVYNLSYSEHLGFFCLQSHYRGETYFFPPLGPSLDRLPEVLNALRSHAQSLSLPLRIRGIPRELVRPLMAASDHRGIIQADRAHWDYVYLTRDLIGLEGRQYQRKRSQIRRFAANYSYRYHQLTPAHFSEAISVFDSWASAHPQDLLVTEERSALLQAFSAYDKLPLQGGYLEVDGQMIAFSLGSLMNPPDTALIHFEKTLADLSEAYAVINQEFAAHTWKDTQFINREDDLGLPGLREAKLRYHPAGMLEKYVFDWDG